MMNEMILDLLQREHARDLLEEAAQERLARQLSIHAGLQCQLCLRLGQALMALGQRLADHGAPAQPAAW